MVEKIQWAWWSSVKFVAPLSFGLHLYQGDSFSTGYWMAMGTMGFIMTYRGTETK